MLVLEGITNVRVVKEKLGKSFLYCAPHDFADCQLYILRLVGLAFLLLILFVTVTAYLAGLLHQNKTVVKLWQSVLYLSCLAFLSTTTFCGVVL